MSNKLRLTIGIPTYNGSKYIEKAIQSVVVQLDDALLKTLDVKMLIADNCSSDDTGSIVSRMSSDMPGLIKYHMHNSNIGYDRNVDFLVRFSGGDYMCLLGDDDMLLPNSLAKISSVLLNNKDISVACLEPSYLEIQSNKIIDRNLEMPETILCNGDDFLMRSRWQTSALSSLCVNVDHWRFESLCSYYDTNWIHIGAILEMMKYPDRRAVFVRDQIVVVRTGNPRWSANFANQALAGFNHLLVLKSMTKLGYREETFNAFRDDKYQRNMRAFLNLGNASFVERLKLSLSTLSFYFYKPSTWFLHLPIIWTPNIFIKVAKRLFKKSRIFSRR